jgi:twitching motility protein PilT
MAELDKFIAAMLTRAGTELLLAPEAEPVIVVDGAQLSLTSRKPNVQQVRRLVAEVAPKEARVSFTTTGGGSFEYRVGNMDSVLVEVGNWSGDTLLRVTPAGAGRQSAARASAPELLDPNEVILSDGLIGDLDAPPPAPPLRDIPGARGMDDLDLRGTQTSAGGPPIDDLFQILVETGSSDLHMSSDEIPMIRKDGEMRRLDFRRLDSEGLYELLLPIIPDPNREEFDRDGDTDFAYEIKGLARFRANLFRDRKGVGAVFRTIPEEILTVDQLGLSKAIQNLCNLTKGLVLVTGPTGSGKSTTLCAMVDLINRTRADHIITIEDPIEFVHENKKCLVNQREVGVHTQGFKRALRAALREDPDIVLVGEMRDLETIAIAIETAETGHLVFGTLHTSTAYSTIDRIIDQFPPDQQEQIRVMLSESLRGVISQTLCKKIGGGRVAALEVLLSNPAVANLIREGKTFQIPSIMQTNRGKGMVLLNEALVDLVQKNIITHQEALMKAVDKATLKTMLKNANLPHEE